MIRYLMRNKTKTSHIYQQRNLLLNQFKILIYLLVFKIL